MSQGDSGIKVLFPGGRQEVSAESGLLSWPGVGCLAWLSLLSTGDSWKQEAGWDGFSPVATLCARQVACSLVKGLLSSYSVSQGLSHSLSLEWECMGSRVRSSAGQRHLQAKITTAVAYPGSHWDSTPGKGRFGKGISPN